MQSLLGEGSKAYESDDNDSMTETSLQKCFYIIPKPKQLFGRVAPGFSKFFQI